MHFTSIRLKLAGINELHAVLTLHFRQLIAVKVMVCLGVYCPVETEILHLAHDFGERDVPGIGESLQVVQVGTFCFYVRVAKYDQPGRAMLRLRDLREERDRHSQSVKRRCDRNPIPIRKIHDSLKLLDDRRRGSTVAEASTYGH